MNARVLIPLALLAAVAVAALSGVFSSGGPSSPTLVDLRNAADATAHATGAHIALAITSGGGPVQVSATGNGEVDPATQEADFTMSVTAGGEQPQQTTLSERMTAGTLYVESPQLSEQLGEGRRWVSIDINQLRQAVGGAPASTSYGVNPSEYLSYLQGEGAQVSARGSQVLRGESVTFYSGTLNMLQAVRAAGGSAGSQAAEKLSSQMRDASSVPLEAWVDHSGRVRKLALSLESQQGQRINIVVEYFDFGPIRPVTPPPAGEVFDLTSTLLSHLG